MQSGTCTANRYLIVLDHHHLYATERSIYGTFCFVINQNIRNIISCVMEEFTLGMTLQREFLESRIANGLLLVLCPVLLLVGSVGNVLSLVVLSRRNLRVSVITPYLLALAVFDTSMLYSGLLHDWFSAIKGQQIRFVSSVLCKIQLFLLVVSKWMSAWILGAVSVHRLLSVVLPLRTRLWFTYNAGVVVICTLAVFAGGVNTHFFFTHGYAAVRIGNVTHHLHCAKLHPYFAMRIWPWMDFILGSLIPFMLILCCNVLIATRIRQLKRQRDALSEHRNEGVQGEAKTRSMTIMLLTTSALFLILTAPMMIYFIGRPYWRKDATPHIYAKLDLVFASANILQYSNHAANFYLYFLSGKEFRRQVALCICPAARVRIHPATPPTRDPQQSAPGQAHCNTAATSRTSTYTLQIPQSTRSGPLPGARINTSGAST